MSGFIVTPLALADLEEIGRFTETRWGRSQRNLYLTQLDEAFGQLAVNPSLGRKRDDIRSEVLSRVHAQHVILYRVLKDRVEILRVLHQRMDVDSKY